VLPDYVVKLSPSQVEEINKVRASADDVPEEAADGMGSLPDAKPASDGDPVAKAPAEKRDPAELIEKGIDPQLETAVLLLQGRAIGRAANATDAPARPAQRPGEPADKARS
jgi:hypothetical protein